MTAKMRNSFLLEVLKAVYGLQYQEDIRDLLGLNHMAMHRFKNEGKWISNRIWSTAREDVQIRSSRYSAIFGDKPVPSTFDAYIWMLIVTHSSPDTFNSIIHQMAGHFDMELPSFDGYNTHPEMVEAFVHYIRYGELPEQQIRQDPVSGLILKAIYEFISSVRPYLKQEDIDMLMAQLAASHN